MRSGQLQFVEQDEEPPDADAVTVIAKAGSEPVPAPNAKYSTLVPM